MKKRISLLLCALMLLLSVQSACAIAILSQPHMQTSNQALNLEQSKVYIVNKPDSKKPTVKSTAYKNDDLDSILDSVAKSSVSRNPSSASNTIPRAIITDLKVTDEDNNPVTAASGFVISIPMNEIASAGTTVQNVQVFHGTRSLSNGGSGDDEYEWAELQSALTLGERSISYNPGAGVSPSPDADTTTGSPSTSPSSSPSDDPDSTPSNNVNDYTIDGALPKNAPSVVRSNLNLVFLTQSCSPFIIVWDEIPLYSDVPQTGDSSSSMTWFVLLAASCAALLVLRRRVRRA